MLVLNPQLDTANSLLTNPRMPSETAVTAQSPRIFAREYWAGDDASCGTVIFPHHRNDYARIGFRLAVDFPLKGQIFDDFEELFRCESLNQHRISVFYFFCLFNTVDKEDAARERPRRFNPFK